MPIPQVPSQLAVILATGTYNANWFSGTTSEQKIQNAINAAATDGAPFVFVPINLEGFDPALLTQNASVLLITETQLMGPGQVVLDVTRYAGTTAGDKIIAALTDNSNGGGDTAVVVDMRRFTGTQIINKNIVDYGVWQYSKKPVVWLWGSAEYWIEVSQKAMTNHIHYLDGAKLIFGKKADGTRNLGQYGFIGLGCATQLVTTVGSGTVTLTGSTVAAGVPNAIVPGHGLAIFGAIPRGGRDNTTIAADPGSAGVSIQVASTTGFPSVGWIIIPNNAGTDYEIVRYTSINATNFLSCTRGYEGTTAVAHNIGAAVNRPVYETYIVKSISGNTITLDEGRTVPLTSSALSTNAGPYAFKIDGHGIIDGNYDSTTDDTANPQGVYTTYARHNYFGPGLTFQHWDHCGVSHNASQDCKVYSRIIDSTLPSILLGSATWLFGNCKRNTIDINVENCYLGCYVDSRSIIGQLVDGPSDNNVVIIRTARNVTNPIRVSGSRGNYLHVMSAVDMPASGTGITEDGDAQWITSGNLLGYPQHNVLIVDSIEGTAGFQAIAVNASFGDTNVLISRTRGAPVTVPVNTGTGINIEGPKGYVKLTDAATIAVNAVDGDTMEVTLGGNRAMGIPSNLYKGRYLDFIIIQDGTGGRTLTWNAVFKHTWSNVGNVLNTRSTIRFYCYDGVNLAQVGAQGPYV